jgi:hypothetical protein
LPADGGHSKVRELLGIGYQGRGAFSKSLTIYFTADLSQWLDEKPWSIIYVNNPVLAGFFRMNRSGRVGFLGVNTLGDPKKDPVAAVNAAADVSEAHMIELVRAGVGQAGPGRQDRRLLRAGARLRRWRSASHTSRTFIIGDAAHLMPPNGGFGGNTGIHDAAQPGLETGAGDPRPGRIRDCSTSYSTEPPAGGTIHGGAGVLALRGAHCAVARGHAGHRSAGTRLRHRDRLSLWSRTRFTAIRAMRGMPGNAASLTTG